MSIYDDVSDVAAEPPAASAPDAAALRAAIQAFAERMATEFDKKGQDAAHISLPKRIGFREAATYLRQAARGLG